MNLDLFISKYRYKKDKNYDDWKASKPDSEGIFYGDCESFVLTAKDLGEQGNITWCYINNVGHVILVDKDRYLDCNSNRWKLIADMPNSYTGLRRMWKIEIILRKIKGSILSKFYKDN